MGTEPNLRPQLAITHEIVLRGQRAPEIWSVQDPMIRRDLTDTAISELVRHAVAEEMYVYPGMRKHLPDGENAVEHDVEEHKELERTMKQLEAVDVSSTEFDATLRQLETLLADHVQDEVVLTDPDGNRIGIGSPLVV